MGRTEGSVGTLRIPTTTNKVSMVIGGRGRMEGKVETLATIHTPNRCLSHVWSID